MRMSTALAAWEAFFDDQHQRYYYYNADTGVSTWELPAELDKVQGHNHEPVSAWKELFDDHHQRYYYYNAVTGVSTWELPAELESPRTSEGDNYNADTGVSTWELLGNELLAELESPRTSEGNKLQGYDHEPDLHIFGADDPVIDKEKFTSARPAEWCTEVMLEEIEHDTTTITSVQLTPDGVLMGATDGPIPAESYGEWSLDGNDFWMLLTRTFETEVAPYSVTRIYHGEIDIDDALPTISGEVQINEFPVGYFKILRIDPPSEE